MNINELLEKQPLLLYDGECGFCNKMVLFYLKNETNNKMNFISLQSNNAKELKKYFEIDEKLDSLILIKNHTAFIKTCAVFRLCRNLKMPYPILTSLLILPPIIRHFFYDVFARFRKHIIKNKYTCANLSVEHKSRFIED